MLRKHAMKWCLVEGPLSLPASPSGSHLWLPVTRLDLEVLAGLRSPGEGSLDSQPSHLWLVVDFSVESTCLGHRGF